MVPTYLLEMTETHLRLASRWRFLEETAFSFPCNEPPARRQTKRVSEVRSNSSSVPLVRA